MGPIDRTLSGATTPGQSGPLNEGNEEMRSQSTRIISKIYIRISCPQIQHKKQQENLVELVKHLRGAYDKFPDFFRMSTFIDSTHRKL